MAGVTNAKIREEVTNLHEALLGKPTYVDGPPGALGERATEAKQHATDLAEARREHTAAVGMAVAEDVKTHANEKAGDILGGIKGVLHGIANHAKWAGEKYADTDAKLDAIAKKLAHSRWTALIFAAWTVLCIWFGARMF